MTITRAAALAEAAARIDRTDARLLLMNVAAVSHAELIAHSDAALAEPVLQAYRALVARRAAGEPYAYLVGEAAFRTLTLKVDARVLVPRPDTECLVECTLHWLENRAAPRVLDLGTGSGAVALALAAECPRAKVVAVDVSPDALAVAQDNGERLGIAVDWRQSDWFSAVSGERFDLVVGNPPYIAAEDPHLQGDGLRYEPPGALTDGVAGGGGLACLRAIITTSPDYLLPGGGLLLEHGWDQAEACRNALSASGFSDVQSWRDLGGQWRVSGGIYGSVGC